jgi:transcriptional regulator with XRE-family HTH domain
MADLVRDLRAARLSAGLSQRAIAGSLHCSRQLIGHLEAGRIADPGVMLLCQHRAVVGLDVSLRGFPGGSPLRDAAQLRLLARFLGSRHLTK